jgi:isocitrate dehydrogenase (NAD+)
MAMMLSGVLMLRFLGEREAADTMERAIAGVIAEGKSITYDLVVRDAQSPVSTLEVASAVIERI